MKRSTSLPLPAAANDTPLILGPGTRLLGCLETSGDLHLHCDVDGEVRGQRIMIGKSARIAGTVVADEVIVSGKIENGLVFADRIVLGDGCDVSGELYYKALDIEAGSYYEGKSRRVDDPKSRAPALPE